MTMQLLQFAKSTTCRIQRAVTELVAGVTRYRRRLDLIITQLTGVTQRNYTFQ